ncbi:MAG: hypothetical protein O2931_01105, partial [Planctomycetota bacterium]|nr:hypothetical protein [Planctomycetota bacterium]
NHWLRTIRTMVAGSDVDLQEENVRIVDLTNGRIYTSDDANGLADVEWGKLNMKRSQEKYWEDKIGRVLTSLQEDFEISVTVNDAFAQASPTDNDDSPETDKTLQRGEIVASVFLKRDISRLSSDSQWQQQHATLVGTLQAMDPRMHVSIFAVPREESPQLAAQPWTLPWAQGKWAEATANRHQNWNVAAAGIVLIVIWSLCVGFRRRRIRAQLNALRAEASATYYEEPAEEFVEEQDLVSRVGTIVRDNPDVAAQVIHNWMRKAG